MPQSTTEMSTIVNEVSGTTSMKIWKFEIFHSEFVDGIRQACIDGAIEKHTKSIGKAEFEPFKFIMPYFLTICYIRYVTYLFPTLCYFSWYRSDI